MTKSAKTDERPVITFRIDPDLVDGLRRLFERDGISQSESIRRALRLWLESKAIASAKTTTRSARKRKSL